MKKLITSFLLLLALIVAFPLPASARGGETGGGTVTTCSPIANLTVKGDARVGEFTFGSVEMSWSVKPCDQTQPVRVITQISNWNTKEVLYENQDSALSDKVKRLVPSYQLYEGRVTVLDATTGEILATQAYVVSTRSKGI